MSVLATDLPILVQSNFGRTQDLEINGFPLGEKIAKEIEAASQDKGSIMSVLATDLPLSSRQIHRILKRLGIGLGRTGSRVGLGSGDVMIGFSTANVIDASSDFQDITILNENKMDLAFRAAIEAEEEAVLNSMVAADTVKGYTGEISSDFQDITILNENKMDLAFRAAIEAEEEAVLNSMVAADTVKGYTGEIRCGIRPYMEKYLMEILH